MTFQLFIGFDPRLALAWRVCQRSVIAHAAVPPDIRAVGISTLGASYGRPTRRDGQQLIDAISAAPMATEFSLARFYVPLMCRAHWAIFCDGDFMFRADVARLLDEVDPRRAVSVVKHQHVPAAEVKMDGQIQTRYPRKNWSSLMVWNMAHAGTRRLQGFDANTKPGLWLHQLGWLRDDEIGELDPRWNWLEGTDTAPDPLAVHFTRGTPNLPGYEQADYADEWRSYLTQMEQPCAPAAFATA